MARSRAGRPRPLRTNSVTIPDRLPYPCFFLCGDCGWLEDGSRGDPLRRDSDELAAPGPCPSCQAKAWVDLGRQSTALAYREAEALDGRLHDETGRNGGVMLGGLAGIAVAAWMVVLDPLLAEFPSLMVAVFFGTWLATALGVNAIVRRVRPGRARPRRWRRPLPRTSTTPLRAAHGLVEGEPVLHAPLGHEPCLGWEVRVYNDEGLLLDEQRHAALTIDGHAFAPDSIALDLTRHELRPTAIDDGLAQFLRRRGLSPHDATLRITLAHLVPGTAVALEPRADTSGGLVLRPVAQLGSPALAAHAA